MTIVSQAGKFFACDLRPILNYAETISREIFDNKGLVDALYSVSIKRCGTEILVELEDDYENQLEFPVEYLSLTLDEIRIKEAEQERERLKKENARLEKKRVEDIENCKRTVQFCENSIKQAKLKYKELTGENYGEPNT